MKRHMIVIRSVPPQPNKTERRHLATRVSFSLRNVEKWDIMGIDFRLCGGRR
nr:MAG TPA: hypothetical protein [Caudoviricetes sp.]